MQPLKLTYSLSENDFLQQLLYKTSKSDRIKKKRLQSHVLASLSMLLLASIFFYNNNMVLTYAFLIFAVYTIIFYPRYLRSHYKIHYKKHIDETFKGRVKIESTVQIDNKIIQLNDRAGENKLHATEVEQIAETGSYFYLVFKTGEYLIIPKLAVYNPEEVKAQLNIFCNDLNIPYTSEIGWKWK